MSSTYRAALARTFPSRRGTDYRADLVEMHISEIGFCGGHSASGRLGRRTCAHDGSRPLRGGRLCNVAHNYMLGAMVYGQIAGEDARRIMARSGDRPPFDPAQIETERERVCAPD